MTKDQFADASKTMTDCQQLQKEADLLAKEISEMQAKIDSLEKVIDRALDFLACMDRISDKETNEQLAMDVLNEALHSSPEQALSGCFQNGNSHEEKR